MPKPVANPPLPPRSSAPVTLLTLGYEGLPPADYFEIMQSAGGVHLVDVRRRPQSRKPGYSKSRLAEAAELRGLAYTHLVDLGTPREILYAFREDKNAAKFHQAYSDYLDTVPEALDELAALAQEQTCCLLCYEADVAHCHRREVAERVQALLGGEVGCRVVHLTQC